MTAVRELPLPDQVVTLLESWLPHAGKRIRFFDVVLYNLVRCLPETNIIRTQWINKGIAIAVQTKDFSLIESLILILRSEAVQHEPLMHLAKQFAADSKQMKRVLLNACNIRVL